MEMREFAVPIPKADDAVLKVEACGICGSDYHYYKDLDHWPYLNPPHIMGHEVVGRIAAIGGRTSKSLEAERRAIASRSRRRSPASAAAIVVTGNATLCGDKRSYGISASMADPPHLWGGYAQYMYLHPNTILHPVPAGVSPTAAVLYTCISNGLKWAQRVPALSPGDSVVILGPGQQGPRLRARRGHGGCGGRRRCRIGNRRAAPRSRAGTRRHPLNLFRAARRWWSR